MHNMRNFSIIAHIDHGKSTLSSRLIQMCNGISAHKTTTQMLSSMELERERGITIKAQSVTLNYKALNGQIYQLNFIDTPGHVDFYYEVSRSLAACEGALLIVDAGQGVEAQTLANCFTAMEMNVVIVPVISKIDLPSANPNRVAQEIENIIGINATNIIRCSAKTGIGMRNLVEKLVHDIPIPKGDPLAPLQALIIDSWFDNYLGVISLVRIKNGTLNRGDKIKVISSGLIYNVDKMGIFTPKSLNREKLNCGEIGWLVCNIKDIRGVSVGDTLTSAYQPAANLLPGFKKVNHQVYASMFPANSNDYESFHKALGKLSLNDAALFYESESSSILGSGFRCGFLGLLHMEIIQERLEREYNLHLIITAPAVIYEVITKNNNTIYVNNPSQLPSFNDIRELREPIAECHILLPKAHLGNIITLCAKRRGVQINVSYYDNLVALIYEIPMIEVILNFFDQLKSISHGYASLNYKFKYFRSSNMVRIDILINSKKVDALALITHRDSAFYKGRDFVNKLHDLIPRQQFNIIIQAVVENNIIARSVIKQLRKNVLAKCYGGDVSRKQKLLKKQKRGKKRMKQIGKVNLPQEAFLAILHIGRNN